MSPKNPMPPEDSHQEKSHMIKPLRHILLPLVLRITLLLAMGAGYSMVKVFLSHISFAPSQKVPKISKPQEIWRTQTNTPFASPGTQGEKP